MNKLDVPRVHPVAYAEFWKGGARKFRKFEKNKDQNENFFTQNQSDFPVLGAGQKQRSSPTICMLKASAQLTNAGAMPQFCILFYANYTILATQRGGMDPPKYAPESTASSTLTFQKSTMKDVKLVQFWFPWSRICFVKHRRWKIVYSPKKPLSLCKPLRFVQFVQEVCPGGEYLWLDMLRAADES